MIGRMMRKLFGHGLREQRAEEVMREHLAQSAPEKRAIKARGLAIERLVEQLQKDTATWH